jgi:serine/threonine-protein kinase
MASLDTLVGHTVGGFEVEEFLGDEQLGKVWLAKERSSGRRVQLKVLNPHVADQYEAAGRFQREMVATASLEDHPHVVRMLDFGDHHGVFHYIVMEDFVARTLSDELLRGALAAERAVGIVWQVASVLDAAHSAGIVHRNLRPENVMLLEGVAGDYVKVRDFGLARGGDDGGEQLTTAGARVGTVAYMAPEYIEMEEVVPKGDVYGLGCLLFQMVAGRPPYEGKKARVLEAHVVAEIPSVIALAPETPLWVAKLIGKMLDKSPDSRLSAREVMTAIEQGLGGRPRVPPAPTRAVRGKTSGTVVLQPAGGSGAWAFGAAAVVLGVAAVGLLIAIGLAVLAAVSGG